MLARVRSAVPGSDASFRLLDLSSLREVEQFAAEWQGPIGLLINNGAVMGVPKRRVSRNGYEIQFATNYLAHFALTLHLLPALLQSGSPRVVSVASLAHRAGRIDFDDLQGERDYGAYRAYAQSKLAMLLFARELQKRADAYHLPLRSVAAHPGWSATGIVGGMGVGLKAQLAAFGFRLLAQSAERGTEPILFAALDDAAEPGGYYGPSRLAETRGPSAPARVMPQAADAAVAARLWDVSEELAGITLASVVAKL